MSTSTIVSLPAARSSTWLSRIADYVELTKPRILVMVLVAVSLSATIATWGHPNVAGLLHTLFGATCVAASASVLNQWIEARRDARMRRTERRPLPAGRLHTGEAIWFGTVTVLLGLAYLLNLVNSGAAFWAALTWLLYVGVYTPLKTRTWLNTHIGAIPGALPILIGWAGTGAEFSLWTWSLFLLVFLWQFPHFMAIAWIYRHQYAAANMQMLTVVDPTGLRAGRQATFAALSVVVVSLIPLVLAVEFSWIYAAFTLALGLVQWKHARNFHASRDEVTARRLLRTSLIYLPLQLILVTLLSLNIL